ncbi:major facilitator superfamily domain-containing protein [Amylostereum chailletii]|nr:major facilitator superfamily domain-containing protein [Amylostereum chailletii]
MSFLDVLYQVLTSVPEKSKKVRLAPPAACLPTLTSNDEVTPANNSDPELKLPRMSSLIIVIMTNALSQISFFIVVSSGSRYAEHLGGTATFSGLVIGIPVVTSGLALVPSVRIDRGTYKWPLVFSTITAVIGHILYALAYRAHFLYLVLIGRMVIGVAFINFLYTKRYCSDSRVVGTRRRTTLAGWLVVGQSVGFTVGPFLGGLLYKVGFEDEVFNGYTAPGWLMAVLWLILAVVTLVWFEDIQPETVSQSIQPSSSPKTPASHSSPPSPTCEASPSSACDALPSPLPSPIPPPSPPPFHPTSRKAFDEEKLESYPQVETATPTTWHLGWRQWGVVATMCWFAMTSFFVLGAWEANIPVYTASTFAWNPFNAGNLIALGGLCTFPFMLLNIRFAPRIQDRYILAVGSFSGLIGLTLTIALIVSDRMNPRTLFACWLFVAFGLNLASTITLSLLSKQLPCHWNGKTSLIIQYSNYTGRVSGTVLGGAGVKLGMENYVAIQIAVLGVGIVMFIKLWKELRAKKG